ncbi:MAG: outer membrane protein OmpA-like peptidoglycan-associated protein [Polaribacter sp.]|jgi:outer membrane protein OmpA-like peptidoglycan-associated protein
MNTGKIVLFGLCLLAAYQLEAQQIPLEGYVYESNNRGFLKRVKVLVLGAKDNKVYLDTFTNKKGVFSGILPIGKDFKVIVDKKHFFQKDTTLSTINLNVDQKAIFAKIQMDRKPGYVFDVTMARAGDDLYITESIQGARIEIYNNTTSEEEMVLNNYPYPNFKFTFENGNHYTIMIRKKGYFNKRMEAYINVEGCILCFEGLGLIDPGVTDVMTDRNKQGTFLANVELEPVELNKTFRIDNIYYDYDKYYIRKDAALELDKLVTVLKDNPAIQLEMGSHTDSRGSESYNMSLSKKRAAASVDYLASLGVDRSNLLDKGYGEISPANRCEDGVSCSSSEHQFNRRTELKIVGISEDDPLDKKSLKEILTEERLMKEVLNSPVVRGE